MYRLHFLGGQRFGPGAIPIHEIDLSNSILEPHKGDPFSVRRPGRIFVIGVILGQLTWIRSVNPCPEQLFFAGNDRDVDKFLAIRRQGGVNVYGMFCAFVFTVTTLSTATSAALSSLFFICDSTNRQS